MTALVDTAFRAFAAATQGDRERMQVLLAGMSGGELGELSATVTVLCGGVIDELARRTIAPPLRRRA